MKIFNFNPITFINVNSNDSADFIKFIINFLYLTGNGAGQTIAVACVMTYYASLMSLIIYYLFASFSSVLPWTVCEEEWTNCYPSGEVNNINDTIGMSSSSELYFL